MSETRRRDDGTASVTISPKNADPGRGPKGSQEALKDRRWLVRRPFMINTNGIRGWIIARPRANCPGQRALSPQRAIIGRIFTVFRFLQESTCPRHSPAGVISHDRLAFTKGPPCPERIANGVDGRVAEEAPIDRFKDIIPFRGRMTVKGKHRSRGGNS